jgi:hypothetical protein
MSAIAFANYMTAKAGTLPQKGGDALWDHKRLSR